MNLQTTKTRAPLRLNKKEWHRWITSFLQGPGLWRWFEWCTHSWNPHYVNIIPPLVPEDMNTNGITRKFAHWQQTWKRFIFLFARNRMDRKVYKCYRKSVLFTNKWNGKWLPCCKSLTGVVFVYIRVDI